MENSIIDQRQKLVTKSNKLIQEGRFSLTAQQQRILLYLISKIDPGDSEFKPCTISILDLQEICGTFSKNYSEPKKAIKDLADCSFWIESEGQSELKRWISSEIVPKFDYRSGSVTLCLSNSVREYLLELRERFTSYELEWVLAFRRKYSVRLYEYICSRHYDKNKPYTFTVSVENLMAIMGANTDVYKRFANFHQKILAPSVAEIDQRSDKSLEYELIIKRRSVTAISFTVSHQPGTEIMKRDKYIQRLLGYDPDQLNLWDKEYYHE